MKGKKLLVLETKEYRIVSFGLDGAGKSSLIKAYLKEEGEIHQTHGFVVKPLDYKDLKLAIWDIGGEAQARDHWVDFLSTTLGLVWVVDAKDQTRLEESKKALHKLLEEEQIQGVPLLIFWNKCDDENLDLKALNQQFELDTIQDREWTAFESSAKTGRGINEGMDWILEKFHKKVQSQ